MDTQKIENISRAIKLIEQKNAILRTFPKSIFSKEREVAVKKYSNEIDTINDQLSDVFVTIEDFAKNHTDYLRIIFGYGYDNKIDIFETILTATSRSYYSEELYSIAIKELKKLLYKVKEDAVEDGRENEIIQTLTSLQDKITNTRIGQNNFRDDLLQSLKESAICYENKCYIAALALSGKILEISLKIIMDKENINYDDSWMIGTLLKKILESDIYIDPAMKNISNIININRIGSVHAKDAVPIPSRQQAGMVLLAVADILNRAISHA